MDIKSLEERSKNMAAIHSKNTKPEIYLRKLLFARGYRYGVNSKSVPGHPDIYMKKYNTAIFVHGCFWHRHEGCKYAYMPKSKVEFWQKKFDTNVKRDKTVRKELLELKIKQNSMKCMRSSKREVCFWNLCQKVLQKLMVFLYWQKIMV